MEDELEEDEDYRTCDICDKTFANTEDLNNHIPQHHQYHQSFNDPLSSASFTCPPLQKSTKFQSSTASDNTNQSSPDTEFSKSSIISPESNDAIKQEYLVKYSDEPSELKKKSNNVKEEDLWDTSEVKLEADEESGEDFNQRIKAKFGLGEKRRSKPKAKWNQYYSKQDDAFSCLACGKMYETIRGIHYHLSKTSISCATPGSASANVRNGGETLSGGKNDWSSFYTRQDHLFICLTCSKAYESINGMHYHLKSSAPCTSNFVAVKEENVDVPPTPTYRRDYRHLYRKGEMGELECLGCGVVYNSIHGLHCHLNATRKESESCFVCLGCESSYYSMHGLHYHLNRTRCGYGEQERTQSKRNYKGLYVRHTGNLFMCLGPGCGYTIGYLTGMHRHLRECPVAGLMTERSAELMKDPQMSFQLLSEEPQNFVGPVSAFTKDSQNPICLKQEPESFLSGQEQQFSKREKEGGLTRIRESGKMGGAEDVDEFFKREMKDVPTEESDQPEDVDEFFRREMQDVPADDVGDNFEDDVDNLEEADDNLEDDGDNLEDVGDNFEVAHGENLEGVEGLCTVSWEEGEEVFASQVEKDAKQGHLSPNVSQPNVHQMLSQSDVLRVRQKEQS